MSELIVRPMRREEMDWAVGLAAKEGWNPGLGDAECFYRTDPEGFLVATLDDRPVGCISAVRYPEKFGFMGFYIVLPEYRGQGYSLRLWEAAMARMKGYNAGGDGVVEMVPKYLTAGFRFAYRNFRYGGTPPAVERPPTGVSRIDSGTPLEPILAYDRRCFPAPREAFLRCWLGSPNAVGYAAGSEETLRGYGVIRRCFQGFKIGPLFADDPETADALFRALCHHTNGEGPVFLDTPAPNPAAIHLAERYALTRVFETARIYTGEPPAIDLDRVFGVTTFELG